MSELDYARECDTEPEPAEDERVKEIARRFAMLPFWGHIEPYVHHLRGKDLLRELILHDVPYLLSLLPVQPAANDFIERLQGNRSWEAQPVASTPTDDEIDEVQHRAEEVVNAAIEWHQSGREGDNTWFDKSEALAAAIDRLLELRQPHSDVKGPITITCCGDDEHGYIGQLGNIPEDVNPADFHEQARQLVDEFRFRHPPPQDLRFLEWEPLVAKVASFASEAATQGQAVGVERAAQKCDEIAIAASKNADIMRQQKPPAVIAASECHGANIGACDCADEIRSLSPDPNYLDRVCNEAATAALEQATQVAFNETKLVADIARYTPLQKAACVAARIRKLINAIGDDKP